MLIIDTFNTNLIESYMFIRYNLITNILHLYITMLMFKISSYNIVIHLKICLYFLFSFSLVFIDHVF